MYTYILQKRPICGKRDLLHVSRALVSLYARTLCFLLTYRSLLEYICIPIYYKRDLYVGKETFYMCQEHSSCCMQLKNKGAIMEVFESCWNLVRLPPNIRRRVRLSKKQRAYNETSALCFLLTYKSLL